MSQGWEYHLSTCNTTTSLSVPIDNNDNDNKGYNNNFLKRIVPTFTKTPLRISYAIHRWSDLPSFTVPITIWRRRQHWHWMMPFVVSIDWLLLITVPLTTTKQMTMMLVLVLVVVRTTDTTFPLWSCTMEDKRVSTKFRLPWLTTSTASFWWYKAIEFPEAQYCYQLAVLHGIGRFKDDTSDTDDNLAHHTFSVLFHLSYASALSCAPACLAIASVLAGLETMISTLIKSI